MFHFRKIFTLDRVPATFRVHVSGDNRYRFFVNGISVCSGPQSSDPAHWRYETVDIAPQLRPGRNVLAAAVWNFGDDPPYGMMGVQTALLVQGDGPLEAVIDTGPSWRVLKDEAYAPLPINGVKWGIFLGVGPGDIVDGAKYPWGWATVDFDDAGWHAAQVLRSAVPASVGTDVVWGLLPRSIPLMEEQPQRLAVLRLASGVIPSPGFLNGGQSITVDPGTRARLVLDQGVLTNAFPVLTVSGGKGSTVRLTYAEALIDHEGGKGHRDEVAGREAFGISDCFVMDGGRNRTFRPLGYRTYRYIDVEIQTGAEALTLEDLSGVATGYPFNATGSFTSDDLGLAKIWDAGWRTARLCAYDTYMDCPYYEQMQYVGDTRIQGLISLYVAGDDRLLRNAIQLFDWSRLPSGLTRSRYPSMRLQIIPTYSLLWVDMLHDYWWHRSDADFVKAMLPGLQSVLGWFERHIDGDTGMLGPLPYWNFVDWTPEWRWIDDARGGGQPAGVRTGGSAIITLQLAIALSNAAEICAAMDQFELSRNYEQLARKLKAATLRLCWDEERQLLADTPEKKSFSQHANALAVLSGTIQGARATELMQRVMDDRNLIACSIYFRFYLLRALKAAGRGDAYILQLEPWQEMMKNGLTTFAEKPGATRSDCHAWSASPVYELLATVCGVEPASAGFGSVKIEPHLGALGEARGRVAHPQGVIDVTFKRRGDALAAEIVLPAGLTGWFAWQGNHVELRGGSQSFEVKPQGSAPER